MFQCMRRAHGDWCRLLKPTSRSFNEGQKVITGVFRPPGKLLNCLFPPQKYLLMLLSFILRMQVSVW